jgi:type IV pilus assembly protein PilE
LRRFKTGFTLIEVMVTVLIIGILAAIAVPNYSSYVTRGRIPEATSALASKQVRMEQFFQDNRTYVGAPTGVCPDTTTSKYFDFTCAPAPTASTFTLVATGKGLMTGFVYTVNEANVKTSAITGVSAFNATSATCWITKTGGVC